MANPDLKGGFKFVRKLDGGKGYPQPMKYPLATTNEPLAKGDLVSIISTGAVDRTCTDGGAAHDQTVCIGVVEAIEYKNSAGTRIKGTYVGASQGDDTMTLGNGTGAIVYVLSGVGNVWSVQCDSGGSVAIAQTLVGNAADPVALEATDPSQRGVSGVSNMELDTSTAGSAADLFHIIGLDPEVGQVFSSTESDSRYGRVLVTFAEHLFGQIPTVSGI